jgi:hypothetical protein
MGEIFLPFSKATDSWFLLIWVLLFYALVGAWITSERNTLDQLPAPRDCIGRRIIEADDAKIDELTSERAHVPFDIRSVHVQSPGNVEC